MRKVFSIIFFTLILSACSLPFSKSQKAALDIKSDPIASVYINNDHIGTTPFYKDDIKPGEYTVRLVVESNPDLTWQTNISLKPQLLTNITRSFGDNEDISSHFTLTLEEISQKDHAEMTVITTPDSAVVKLDGQPAGFAPVELNTITSGDHQVTVSSPGYKPLTIPIKAIAGLRLTIVTKLAKDRDLSLPPAADTPASSSALVEPSPPPSSPTTLQKVSSASANLQKPYVTINPTPTDWLRVRSDPTSAADNEVAKVNSGESFPYVKTNELGWYQIEYQKGKQGWISSQYATLVK